MTTEDPNPTVVVESTTQSTESIQKPTESNATPSTETEVKIQDPVVSTEETDSAAVNMDTDGAKNDLKRPREDDTETNEQEESESKKANTNTTDRKDFALKSTDGRITKKARQRDEWFKLKNERLERDYSKYIHVDGEEAVVAEAEDDAPRRPKKKVAVMLGYAGFNYQGMQINANARTIEAELHKAFAASGTVSKANAFNPAKIGFIRAARTDKGVSAVGQVVSLKLIMDEEDVVQKINEKLPEDIRIWGVKRVNNKFHAKNQTDSRVYEYMLPTYVFSKPANDQWNYESIIPHVTPREKLFPVDELPRSGEAEFVKQREFRISPETLEEVRQVLKNFEGHKDFHNYTIAKGIIGKSSNRKIMTFECSDPFIIDNKEWVRLTVHGHSFMLHQIRKMVGMAILCVRLSIPTTIFPFTFTKSKVSIPKAPALGLFLVECKFPNYNKVHGGREARDGLDFAEFQEEINAFKEKYIYTRIHKEENEEHVFDNWLRTIDGHAMEYMYFLNPEGTIKEDWRPIYMLPGYKGPISNKKADEEDDEEVEEEEAGDA